MSTSMFTISFGAPSALHDIACDQYSSVSNAFDRSAENMCSSFLVTFASSMSSASILIGSCICLPLIPPYCSLLSILLSSITLFILVNITLSSSFSITSISAIGLVLLMSYSPASDFGRGLSTVLFHVAGTCLPPSIILSIEFAILSRFSSSILLTISMVIPEGPGALFDLNFFISSLRSSILISCMTVSHILSSACFCS